MHDKIFLLCSSATDTVVIRQSPPNASWRGDRESVVKSEEERLPASRLRRVSQIPWFTGSADQAEPANSGTP
jgi:hypothetical protein